jgi:hypothetical protein
MSTPGGTGVAAPRVLTVLDDAAAADTLLEWSCALAGALRRELSVVYIESTHSLAAASLPLAQVLPHGGADWLPLETRDIEQGFRAQASRLRAIAERTALRHSVGWSLRVMRGNLAHAGEQLRQESDLLFMAGSTLGKVSGALRISRPQQPRPPRVRALSRGDEAGQRALAVARTLAQALGASLDAVGGEVARSGGRTAAGPSAVVPSGEPLPDLIVLPRSLLAEVNLPRRNCPVLVVD